jgi:plasmid stability protein
MSLELKAVQVRLPEDAYEALRMIADAGDQDLGECARVILTEALLGKSHAIKVLAARLALATKSGRER